MTAAAHPATTTERVENIRVDPVFIIGDHRSGTTLLYQALARTGAFNVVTAYHVIHDRDFVANFEAGREPQAKDELAREFARRGLTDRGIDGVAVTPDLPEEYGFVIDKSSRPRLRPSTAAALADLCRRIRYTGEDKPVLLKNPWDVLDFLYVKRAFPTARLVFVHRDPLMVMNSQVAAMRSIMGARNEYAAMLSPWYRELFDRPIGLRVMRLLSGRFGARMAARHIVLVARYYLSHIAALPPADYMEMKYEELCAAPQPTIDRILAFLRLPHAALPGADSLIRPRPSRVAPEVLAAYRRIWPRIEPFCRRHGYGLPA